MRKHTYNLILVTIFVLVIVVFPVITITSRISKADALGTHLQKDFEIIQTELVIDGNYVLVVIEDTPNILKTIRESLKYLQEDTRETLNVVFSVLSETEKDILGNYSVETAKYSVSRSEIDKIMLDNLSDEELKTFLNTTVDRKYGKSYDTK